MTASKTDADSTTIVVVLLLLWLVLVVLLVFFYRRLNRETNGQYTVQRLVYSQGGLRDRAMQGIELVTTLTARLRPQNRDEEEAIGDCEDGNEDEEEGEEEEGERDKSCQNENSGDENEAGHGDDSSDDYSSIDLRERVKMNNSSEEIDKQKEEEEEKDEEKKEESKDEEKETQQKQEEGLQSEERVGLLVNIKPFSGSAIWSEEQKEESNVTAL